MQCEMCGSEELLYKTSIEGAVLNVCKKCSKFGKVILPLRESKKEKIVKKSELIKEPETELIEGVVEDYAVKIKKAREKLGLKQEEFAKKINEKESLIHNIETGHFEPNLKLARKIEKFLRIRLVEVYGDKNVDLKKIKSEVFTLGDFIKIKKR